MSQYTVRRDIVKHSQSVVFDELLTLNDHVLHLSIESDSYIAQSHARLSRWDGTRWHLVWSLPWGAMHTPSGTCYRADGLQAEHYMQDRETLLDIARTVLGR